MNINSYSSNEIEIEQQLKDLLESPRAESHFFGNRGQQIFNKNDKPSYTREDAKTQKNNVARLLLEDNENPYSTDLGERLKSCSAHNRCGSGACACEIRATSRIICEAGSNLIGNQASAYHTLSGIPLERRYHGNLQRHVRADVLNLKERASKVFNRLSNTIAFGGADISVNSHAKKKFNMHYKLHFWMLVKTPNIEQLKALLKEEFSSSLSVPVPVMVKPYDGRVNALSYAFKYTFQQRISRDNEIAADGSEKRLSPKTDRLRNHEHIEIAHALDELGLSERLFLHGVQIAMVDGLPCFIPNTQGKGG